MSPLLVFIVNAQIDEEHDTTAKNVSSEVFVILKLLLFKVFTEFVANIHFDSCRSLSASSRVVAKRFIVS